MDTFLKYPTFNIVNNDLLEFSKLSQCLKYLICNVYLAPVDVLTDLPALLAGHVLALSLGHVGALLSGHVNTLLAGNLGHCEDERSMRSSLFKMLTLVHCCLGTGMHVSLGTDLQACLGTVLHSSLGTLTHSCLGTVVHCCLGTVRHSCSGTWDR